MNTRLSRRAAVGLIGLMAAFPFAASAAGPQDVALAIKGYDPVAYFTNGRPVQGLPEFEHE